MATRADLVLQDETGKCPLPAEICNLPVDVVFEAIGKRRGPFFIPGLTSPEPTEEYKCLIGGHAALFASQSEGGFPDPAQVDWNGGESVYLTEDPAVLKLLFAFMHSKILERQPVELLRSCDPDHLVGLAVAAEKYGVPSVPEICRLFLEMRVQDMPVETFIYATNHRQTHLANLAAPHTISAVDTDEFLKKKLYSKVTGENLLLWFKFRDKYIALAESILTPPPVHINSRDRPHDCGVWEPYQTTVLNKLPPTTMPLVRLLGKTGCREVVKGMWPLPVHKKMLGACRICIERAKKWEREVEAQLFEIYFPRTTPTFITRW